MALHPPAGNLKKRLTVNGSGCTNLHVFGGGAIDGAYPTGALTVSVLACYGTTTQGGTKNLGAARHCLVAGLGLDASK